MIYLTPTDPISKVAFSTRCHTCLRRAGIKTVSDLMEYGRDKLPRIRNFGAKGVNEVIQFLDLLRAGGGDYRLVSQEGLPISVIEKTDGAHVPMLFHNADGVLCQDIPLESVGLSVRALKGLKQAGYDYASQLINVTEKQLLTNRNLCNLSNSGIHKIVEKIQAVKFFEVKENKDKETENLDCLNYVTVISQLIPIHNGRLYHELLPIFDHANEMGVAPDNEELFAVPYLREAVKDKIIYFLSGLTFGAHINEVESLFSDNIISNKILWNIITEMESNGQICIGDKIESRKMTLLEYAKSALNEKEYDIFIRRLRGTSLKDIGDIYEITKERVRQITKRCLHNKVRKGIVLFEDKYIEVMKKYYITKEDFIYGFDEDGIVWNYLNLLMPIITNKTSKEPRLRLEQLITDESFPVEIRRGAERAIYGNCLINP